MNNSRLQSLMNSVARQGFDALALNPGPSLVYLTGLHFHVMERPVVLLITKAGETAFILPELEIAKVQQARIPMRPYTYGDNPSTWTGVFRNAVKELGLNNARIGVEPTRLRFLELKFLQNALPDATFDSAEASLAGMRLCKDQDEVALMRQAVKIAQDALEATLPQIKLGMTELEIAGELTAQMLRRGAESEMPFPAIVASGPNSANPHSVPGDRKLQAGDLLLFDWGASYRGYISDITRTFAVGAVDPELEKIARIVAEANAAGRATGRPGIPAGRVDLATRSVITKAGYGEFFTHRTGHGIGMEGHEPPYIFAENGLLLESGMAFTVEPGIYLPDRGGVRIEDNIVITADGCECLTDLPRELRRLL